MPPSIRTATGLPVPAQPTGAMTPALPPQTSGPRWLWRWIDRALATGLLGALAMAVMTAWPGAVQAQRAEGNGEAATDTRALGEVSAVVTHSLKVVVRQGPTAHALVQADRNLLPLLETVFLDGPQGKTLTVRWKPHTSIKPRTPALVTITAPSPERLVVEGSGDIIGEQLKLARLTAQVAGSGDIRLHQVQAGELTVAVNGSGDVSASGQAARLSVRINGSGDVHCEGLRAEEAQVETVGSGNAQVQVQRRLAVSITGSGDVVYSGPAAVQSAVVGSGRVTKR